MIEIRRFQIISEKLECFHRTSLFCQSLQLQLVFSMKYHGTSWLDLILSLFFYCCGCPRYWGRQQVARMSNTNSPRLSVQWIDAAKAAHFNVSLNTFRPGLFRPPSSSGARNRHTCDGVYAWRGACNMSIPSQTASAESCCHLLHSWLCTECVPGHFVIISDSAYPGDHWSVVPAKPLQVWPSRCPGFTTMFLYDLILYVTSTIF